MAKLISMKHPHFLFLSAFLSQVVLATEKYSGVADGAFQIILTRPSLYFDGDFLKEACLGKSFGIKIS